MNEPRRRTQIKRYGHDEGLMEISDLESSSGDSNEEPDTAIGVGRGKGKRMDKYKKNHMGYKCRYSAETLQIYRFLQNLFSKAVLKFWAL